MMGTVALVPCAGYNRQEVTEAVRTGVELLGGIGRFVRPEEHILLKPNLLRKAEPDRAVSTHPEVFRAVAALLREAGYSNLTYGDSPGTGSMAKTAEACGMAAPAQELNIPQADFSTCVETAFPQGRVSQRFFLAKGVVDNPAVINICKMKTHALERITGAVKNLYGCVQGYNKSAGHVAYPSAERFAAMLCDLHRLIRPRLHILDGITAMEGNGPASGTPVRMGVLLFSDDPVALDSVFCRLVYLNPELVPTNVQGMKAGIGTYEQVRVLTPQGELDVDEAVERHGHSEFDVYRGKEERPFLKNLLRFARSKPTIDGTRCVGCGVCVDACPVQGKAVHQPRRGVKPTYDYKACIRCFCCQEMCPEQAIFVKKPLMARLADRKW